MFRLKENTVLRHVRFGAEGYFGLTIDYSQRKGGMLSFIFV